MAFKTLCMSFLALGATAFPFSDGQHAHQRRTIPASTSEAYQTAYKFTISHEGFCANYCYPGGLKTIGYGHDCNANNGCAGITVPISTTAAQALFRQDLSSRLSAVCSLPNAGALNANQYAALVSFTFNSGIGNTQKYFGADMSSSNFAAICSALPTTNTQGGSANLSARRQAEGSLCSTATTASSGCSGTSSTTGTGGGGSPSTSHKPTGTGMMSSSYLPSSYIPFSTYEYSSGVYQSTYGGASYGYSGYPTGGSGSYPTGSSGSYPGSGSSPGSSGSSGSSGSYGTGSDGSSGYY